MSLGIRFVLYLVLAAVLTATAFQVVRHLQDRSESRESQKAAGLDWLRHEYRLSDAAFSRIARMHRDYFARCDAMCAEMLAANRPPRGRGAPGGAAASTGPAHPLHRGEKAICERCMNTMVAHLRAVAGVMEPEQGRRFLADILPDVAHRAELGALYLDRSLQQ